MCDKKNIDNFTLRIPTEENEEIKQLAKKLGMSQNALLLLAFNLFKQSYQSIIVQNQDEFLRFLSHKSQQKPQQSTQVDY